MKKAIMLVLVLLAVLMTLPALAEETIDIPVYLQWVDASDRSHFRPDSITVELYAGNNRIASTTSQDFSFYGYAQEYDSVYISRQFKNLPKYDSNGGEIAYRIEAPEFMYYDLEVIARSDGSFLIQYTLNFGTVDIPVRIVWDDENDKDGLRPTSLKVIAEADLTGDWYYEEQTIRKEDDWLYTFRDMNQQEEGTCRFLTYMISLQTPNGYSQEVTGSQSEGYVYTLTHCPAVEIPVKIIWDDQNDLQGKRPDDVWVYLEANYSDWTDSWASEIWLNADRNWAGKFLYSPEYGRPISYSVDPDDVRDYSTTITEENGGFVITYKYDPWPTTQIPVKIVWNDNNDQAGARPEEVDVDLCAEYKEEDDTYWDTVDEHTFSASEEWKYTFEEIKRPSAPERNHTVKTRVEDYTCEVSQQDGWFVITLTYAPTPKVRVPVEIIWNDNNDQAGVRPSEDVMLELYVYYSEDESVKEAFLDAESNWKYTFVVSLNPAYDEEPTFHLKADRITGYTSSVASSDDGYVVTYTYDPSLVTQIPVEIVWDDGNDADGIRPEEVWVDLYVQFDDGESIYTDYVKEIIVSASHNWNRSFIVSNSSSYIKDSFSIEHEYPDKYNATVTTVNGGFVITFTHKPIKAPENPPAPPVPPAPPAAGGTVVDSTPPQTGDNAHVLLWGALMMMSVVIARMACKRKTF